jgi:hypothetical protein
MKPKKKIFLCFICLLSFLVSFSQIENVKEKERFHQSQVFFEGGGPGISLSANYEKSFWKEKNGIGFRAGTGIVPFISTAGLTIPVGFNYVHGRKHSFELGFGATPLIFTGKNSDDSELLLYFLTGYRQLFFNGDVIGRMLFSPFLAREGSIFASNLDIKGKFIPYGGISLGFASKRK